MGYLIFLGPLGTIMLFIYIIFDFVKHQNRYLLNRTILYSFLFYIIWIVHYTIGGIHIPPLHQTVDTSGSIQLIPFSFLAEWISHYEVRGSDWQFWNSIKLSFYNFIMFAPFGIYLASFFQIQSMRKACLILFFSSLTIETYQLIFTFTGLTITRTFNVDDLLLNTLGGMLSFYVMSLLMKKYKRKNKQIKSAS
ncbi:VanZ family protein [Evansella halocellulosilytica]|uniref:VanZ family protein n=1 Tax=Evansella halocellulosilytica TaxID=2011013 RepID=UPI0015CB3722|nr:VanZ family protein [Evansella halocellulosilytica]